MSVTRKDKITAVLLCAFFTFCILYECSQTSPRFVFSTWVDPHCYLTIAKAILKGRIPYRDIYDVKGPLLYLLYVPAALISRKSLSGVFILEALTGTGALYFTWRYLREKLTAAALPLIFLAGVLLFCFEPFSAGGSAEEHALPVLTYCFWKFSSSVQTDTPLGKKSWYLIGILAGIIFWAKYSICFILAGAAVMPLFCGFRKKKAAYLRESVIPGLLGIFTVSAPVLLFFFLHHALSDLFNVYFYSNMFKYALKVVGSRNYNVFTLFLFYTRAYLPFLILGLMTAALRKSGRNVLHILFTAAFAFIPLAKLGDPYNYYYLPFWILTLPGLSACGTAAGKFLFRKRTFSRITLSAVTAASFLLCLLPGLSGGRNSMYLQVKDPKDYYPQFRFAKIIDSVPDSVLLQFDQYDTGFYTVAGKDCPVKYITQTMRDLPELFDEQMDFIEKAGPDFIVATRPDYIFPGYDLIDCRICDRPFYRCSFSLYERHSLRNEAPQ